ncbi:MAG: chromosome segregation protein SMC [Armatimonas sp.]
MHLKRLTLHGFKTFAEKTEIQFVPGVTCIVGPNGSGKSNLLDALVWCLGEQKASSLRAGNARDVIFAGSTKRKPLGMAEVSLTVDNEDRFLPLDFSEITVTRRIYKDGASEYLLNKTACRLKDITDLFLDTGLGRGAYAIVNQSEIDSMLTARPEERRELFEEAAGIKKYRVKKREAQRKLENVETNLVRVRDILSELSGQVEPLREQAEVAQRHKELTGRLREVEVGQLAADWSRLSAELSEQETLARDAGEEAERHRAAELQADEESKTLRLTLSDTERELDDARQLEQSARTQLERLASRIALSTERRQGAEKTLETLASDLTVLDDEKKRLDEEAGRVAAEAREADLALSEKTRELADAEQSVREAQKALDELAKAAAGQEADYLALARKLAAQKAELESLRERLTLRARERAGVQESLAAVITTAATTQEAQKAADSATAVAKEELGIAEEKVTTARDSVTGAEKAVAGTRETLTTLEKRLAGQESRLRALEETEAAQEGYFAGVKSVLRGVDEGRLSGRFTLVADAIQVPAHLETAIEVALGGSLQDIIVETERDAKAAIRYLSESRGGRATFLPLDVLRQVDVPGSLRVAAKRESGVSGSAADLVSFDDRDEAAVNVLLARVLVCEDIEIATQVSRNRSVSDWGRIVTLSGEVVVPTGAITGGRMGRQGPNLLSRKREIAELSDAVDTGRDESDRLRRKEKSDREALEAARTALSDAEKERNTARDAANRAEREGVTAKNEAERRERERVREAERAEALDRALQEETAREKTLAEAVEAAGNADEGAQQSREQLAERRAALSVTQSEVREKARLLSAEAASLRERAQSLKRDAERAHEGALRATLQAGERTRRADDARALIAREEAEEKVCEEVRTEAEREQQSASVLRETLQERRGVLSAQSTQLSEQLRDAQRGIQSASERGQQARLKAARLETQAEGIRQRLMDEYELHPDSAVELTGGVPPAKDVAQEISRLRREIKGLGIVNTGAIEEYERVSERHRFLLEQKTDLEDARTTLNAAITEIDDSTRGVFVETFEAVSLAFQKYFGRLFGGGETQLVMTDPNDVLETGIEIWAQPPGKKRQSLALLSGGERALTATALLFAFLEVRPAPFCVLDEVDAPLDGANVEKFADLVREFGEQSQFILITHNATTMEAAPLWYGVTMQEPGVSKTLSMKVPEQAPSPQ